MKRFILFAICLVAFVTFFTGCYEYDDNELRPVQTYQVLVETQGDLSNADQASLMTALISNGIDSTTMNVKTNNLPEVIKSMRRLLGGVSTGMRIGFYLGNPEDNGQHVASFEVGESR